MMLPLCALAWLAMGLEHLLLVLPTWTALQRNLAKVQSLICVLR